MTRGEVLVAFGFTTSNPRTIATVVSVYSADMTRVTAIFRALAAIAAIEGVVLVGYALFDLVGALLVGTTGPAAVSNASAMILQIAIFAIFGAGMLIVARGWLMAASWVRGPFVLAQLIALVVGVPLISAPEPGQQIVGVGVTALAIVGLVLVFWPSVTRTFAER